MHHQNNNEQLSPELERYLALCERIVERLIETGQWPWPDSPDFDDVVESDDNQTSI